MNNIFQINWFRLVKMLVFPAVQKPVLLAFINALLAPIRTKYNNFIQFKTDTDYRVQHNGQVCYLQKMLNDKFDNSLRRIRVQNVPAKPRLSFYQPEDDKSVFFYEDEPLVHFYTPNSYYNEFDFEVLIPTSLSHYNDQIATEINYYKIYSKNYQIIEL